MIKNFIQINDEIYCKIVKFIKNNFDIKELRGLKNEIELFFTLVEQSNEIEVISINRIIRKCIKIQVDSIIYLTYCVDIDEHD